MKYLFLLLAVLSAGCMSTNVPGVIETRNFGFNQKFTKLNSASAQVNTNGSSLTNLLNVDGYISDATENLKIVVDGLVRSIAAFASSGATTLIPSMQPMMLMTPVELDGQGAARATGTHQPQIFYLVPVGPQPARMPMAPRLAPNGLVYPTPPAPPTAPSPP